MLLIYDQFEFECDRLDDYSFLTTKLSTVTDLMNRIRGNAALRGLLIFIFIIVMLILIDLLSISAVAFTTFDC